MQNHLYQKSIGGMVLAGGKSTRFAGHDKSWQIFNKKSLIENVIQRAMPQVSKLIINSNKNLKKMSTLDKIPIFSDSHFQDSFYDQGPLSGILTGLQWANQQQFNWMMSFPVDTPNFPNNIVKLLYLKAMSDPEKKIICSTDGKNTQYLLTLWSVDIVSNLIKALQKKQNKVQSFFTDQKQIVSIEHFSNNEIFNINTPSELNYYNKHN